MSPTTASPRAGAVRNQLGLSLRVAAVNLQRLLALGLAYDHGWKTA